MSSYLALGYGASMHRDNGGRDVKNNIARCLYGWYTHLLRSLQSPTPCTSAPPSANRSHLPLHTMWGTKELESQKKSNLSMRESTLFNNVARFSLCGPAPHKEQKIIENS